MSTRGSQFHSIFGSASNRLYSVAERTIVTETPIRRTDTNASTPDTSPPSTGRRKNSSADATSTPGC